MELVCIITVDMLTYKLTVGQARETFLEVNLVLL